jgi:Trp operon repressor
MAFRKIIGDEHFRKARSAQFWRSVDKSGGPDACWPWLGTRIKGGYGKVTFLGRSTTAHRIAYELQHGVKIPESLNALHSCDNPPCCNPAHISPDTQASNLEEMREKGRGYQFPVIFGEKAPHAKLTDAQIVEIKAEYLRGEISQTKLAKKYGVGQSQISRVLRGESREAFGGPDLYGEGHWRSKLTDAQVAEIKQKYETGGYTQPELASMYSVGNSQISRIILGQTRTGAVQERSGECAPHAKLTDAQIAEIRRLAASTPRRPEGHGRHLIREYWSERRLAEKFGVGSTQIGRIIRGESR